MASRSRISRRNRESMGYIFARSEENTRLRYENAVFSHCQSEYTHMWKKNNDGQSLPRVGKVASGASRIGF